MKKGSAAAGAGEAAAASILGFHAVRRSKTVRAATNKFRQTTLSENFSPEDAIRRFFWLVVVASIMAAHK